MNRITTEHLQREAIVYVRQSSPQQVRKNLESQRWQYGLTARAKDLGWADISVIDDDLGRSGDGTARRPGFQNLLAAVCENRVGIILAVEASRLARNGREWHTLIEFCGHVGCLLGDEQSVYDPRVPSDRMILGMHGAMSELELSNIMRRSLEGRKRKAERGELFFSVAAGYQRTQGGIEKDPDLRVQEAIALVFRKFDELQSVRQVRIWMQHEGIPLPSLESGMREPVWGPASYSRVHKILTNPVYAGAYAFGRTGTRVRIHDGVKQVARGKCAQEAWQVLKAGNHEAYISWEQFGQNQRVISDNVTNHAHGTRGPVRRGAALLAGLLRCGHCGRRMRVAYTGRASNVVRYHCYSEAASVGQERCIGFGGMRVDAAVCDELVRVLQPLGIEAALQAIDEDAQADSDALRQVELALERARYEAERAARQYDSVDPENRQVAGELERRWNERLTTVRDLETRLTVQRAAIDHRGMTEAERVSCLSLGADLQQAWQHDNVSAQTRKRILRVAIEEIVACVEGRQILLPVCWRGGDHTELTVYKNRIGEHHHTTDAETGAILKTRCAPNARQTGRSASEPTWSQDRHRSKLDGIKCSKLPPPPQDPGLSRRGVGGTWRTHPE